MRNRNRNNNAKSIQVLLLGDEKRIPVPVLTSNIWCRYLLSGYGEHGVEQPDGHLPVVHIEELLVELHGVEVAEPQPQGAAAPVAICRKKKQA